MNKEKILYNNIIKELKESHFSLMCSGELCKDDLSFDTYVQSYFNFRNGMKELTNAVKEIKDQIEFNERGKSMYN